MATFETYKNFLQPTIQAISTVLELPACIWLLDETDETLHVAVSAELLEGLYHSKHLNINEICVASDVFKNNRTIIVTDIEKDNRWKYRDEWVEKGLKSAVVAPLKIKDKTIGILDVYIPEIKNYNANQLRRLKPKVENFAEQISVTLQHIHGLHSLNEVGQIINSEIQDSRKLFERVMQYAQKVLFCEHVTIFLTEKISGDIILKASSSPNVKRKRFRQGEGIGGYVARSGESLLVNDVCRHPDFIKGLTTDISERSMLLCPIKIEKETVGVISADFHGLNGFDNQDLLFLETLSKQTATAIHNVSLYEQLQEQKESQITAMGEISDSIIAPIELNQILDGILDWTIKLMVKASLAEIRLLDKDKKYLEVKRSRGEKINDRYKKVAVEKGITGWVAEHKQSLLIPDVSEDNRYLPFWKDTKSEIAVPIIKEDELIGVLNIEHRESDVFTEYHRKLAEAIGKLSAVAIHNAQLYEKQLEAIKEIAESLTTRSGLDRILDGILIWIKRLMGEDCFAEIRLLDDNSKKELLLRRSTEKIKEEHHKIPIGKGIVGRSALNKEAIMLQDISKPPEGFEYLSCNDKTKSEIAIPMLIENNELIGVLNIEHPKKSAFTQYDFNIAKAIANLATVAIDNSQIYKRLQEQRNLQIEAINQISDSIKEIFEKEPIIDGILDWTHLLMKDASLIAVLILDRKNNKLVTHQYKGRVINDKYKEILIGQGITGKAAQKRGTIYVPDVSKKDTGYLAAAENIKSELAVPIIKRNELIGVLNIEHPQVDAFTDDDIKLAEAIANLAAIAITNVRLYKKQKDTYKKLQDEKKKVEVAYEISKAAHTVSKLEEFYPLIHKNIEKLMFAKNFFIALYDNSRFTLPYFKDEKDKTLLPDEIFNDGLTGIVFREGKPLLTTPEVFSNLVAQGKAKEIGTTPIDWLGVPLQHQEKTIGVMAVQSYNETFRYNKEEQDILMFISEQIAMAINSLKYQAHLKDYNNKILSAHKKLQKMDNQTKVLIELAQKLTSSIQLKEDEILQLIYKNVTELMDTTNMYIALYDNINNEVRFPLAYKEKKPLEVPPRKDGHGRTEKIIIEKQSILIKTREESITWYKQPGRQEYIGDPLASWIGVPMMVRDNVIGVVATYHPTQDNLYNEDDVEILKTMANIAAIALNNARLVNDLKDAQKGIADRERELFKSGFAMDFTHKMNNLAGTIPAWVSLIKRKLKSVSNIDSKVIEYCDKIKDDIGLLLDEAHKLRNPISQPEKIDMIDVVGSIVAQVEMLVAPDIKIEFNDPDYVLFPIYGIKEQIAVAIYSVIQNSVKAISGNGKIMVDIKNGIHKERKYIEINISDTGCGIPKDRLDSIFEYGISFWVDKKGTGYGLWRARSIIQSMKGNIRVTKTKEGEGATFTITLPVK